MDLALVFLGVIAFSSLVQGAFLVGLAVGGLKLVRRMGEIQKTVEDEIRPAIDNLGRVSRNLKEVSSLATQQAQRVEDLVNDTRDRIEEAREQMREAMASPLTSLREIGAMLKGVRRGYDVYQRLAALQAGREGSSRRYAEAEDEHLFI